MWCEGTHDLEARYLLVRPRKVLGKFCRMGEVDLSLQRAAEPVLGCQRTLWPAREISYSGEPATAEAGSCLKSCDEDGASALEEGGSVHGED